MKARTVETSVGLFVLIGLICVGYLTVKLGKMEILGGDHYYLTAQFASVSGLKEGAMIDMAGVQIGQVETITLDKKKFNAIVRFKVAKDIPIDTAAVASVKTSGLLGDQYIKIAPGDGKPLKDGDEIVKTIDASDIEELISQFAGGKSPSLGADCYTLTARFGSATGLAAGGIVDMAGIQIGQVESITLDKEDFNAIVRLKIKNDIPIHADAIASIRSSSLIGYKFVKIMPGGADNLLEDGGQIIETVSAMDLESLIGKFAGGSVD